MAFCGFADNFSMYDITPVENLFIQEFMTRAPGDYVRVYLYGLMLCYHPTGNAGPEEIARALGMENDQVLDACRYWERQGLMTRVTDRPPTYVYQNLKATMLSEPRQDDGLYRYRDFNNSLQALYGSDKLLHPQDFSKAIEWVEELHLPESVVLLLVSSQLGKRGKKASLKSMDKLAMQWAEQGVTTVEQAEELLYKESVPYDAAKQVLRQFNLKREPTKDEVDLVRVWLEEWHMDMGAILYACKETVKGRNPSFGYLNGILERHRESGQSAASMAAAMSEQQDLQKAVRALLTALGQASLQPSPEQQEIYRQWLSQGLEPGAILMIANRCARRGKNSFEDLVRSVDNFRKMNLLTEKQLKRYLSDQHVLSDLAQKVFDQCGWDHKPTVMDIQWIGQCLKKADADLILYAAECSKGTQLPLRYMERVLKNWTDKGISDVERARADREANRAKLPIQNGPGEARRPQKQPLPGQQYAQRQYTQEQMDALVFDLNNVKLDEESNQ